MPTENSVEILVDTHNLINTKIKMLKLAYRESERLVTRKETLSIIKTLRKHWEQIGENARLKMPSTGDHDPPKQGDRKYSWVYK